MISGLSTNSLVTRDEYGGAFDIAPIPSYVTRVIYLTETAFIIFNAINYDPDDDERNSIFPELDRWLKVHRWRSVDNGYWYRKSLTEHRNPRWVKYNVLVNHWLINYASEFMIKNEHRLQLFTRTIAQWRENYEIHYACSDTPKCTLISDVDVESCHKFLVDRIW